MRSRQFQLHNGQKGAALAIRVTPRAKKNEIAGVLSDGTIKIRLTAPPVDGKANDALIKFLANVLEVPRSNIQIIAGEKGRDKLVSITDADARIIQDRITNMVE